MGLTIILDRSKWPYFSVIASNDVDPCLSIFVSGILAAPNAGQSQQCPGPKSPDKYPRRAVVQLVEAASSNFSTIAIRSYLGWGPSAKLTVFWKLRILDLPFFYFTNFV